MQWKHECHAGFENSDLIKYNFQKVFDFLEISKKIENLGMLHHVISHQPWKNKLSIYIIASYRVEQNS